MRRLSFLMLLMIGACSPKKEKVQEADNQLPKLGIVLSANEKIYLPKTDGKVVLIFYNPNCDHCQQQATIISKDVNAFNAYSVYFISANSVEDGKAFAKDFGLDGQKNIYFAHAEIADVAYAMGAIGTPSIYIYSEDKKLVKSFGTTTEMEEIAKFL